MRRPLVIFDFSPDPFRTYEENFIFFFISAVLGFRKKPSVAHFFLIYRMYRSFPESRNKKMFQKKLTRTREPHEKDDKLTYIGISSQNGDTILLIVLGEIELSPGKLLTSVPLLLLYMQLAFNLLNK
jgi:hypothetical protein